MPTEIPSEVRDALEVVARDFPGRLIKRGSDPYLYRYYLARGDSDKQGAFLHRFVSPDDPGLLHSHPWEWAYGFILSGVYREERATVQRRGDGLAELSDKRSRVFPSGSVNSLRAVDFHRVELVTSDVWTLFVHGPRVQTWAFAPEKYGEPVALQEVLSKTYDVAEVVGG
jgi:hypothetical protein